MMLRRTLGAVVSAKGALKTGRSLFAVRLISTKTRYMNEDIGHQSVVDSWRVNCVEGPDAYVGPRDDSWYTGIGPTNPKKCPGINEEGVLTTLPTPTLNNCTRQQMRDYFDNTWTTTEVLFAALQTEEAFYRSPAHELRHPKIFYYGHPAVLYINKFRIAGLLDAPINSEYEHIFATGVDEMQWDDMSKNDMKWPSVAEVTEYRREVYNAVVDVIENHPSFDTVDDLHTSPFWAVVMGTEHERIHLETSSVLMRELPLRLVRTPEHWPALAPASAAEEAEDDIVCGGTEMIPVDAGTVRIGKMREFPSYGWDNEYGDKSIFVKSFRASKHLITNADYREFVKDDGYLTQDLWSEEGWSWRCFRNVKSPTFWVVDGPIGAHDYKLRTLFSEVELPMEWPACVNFHEAKAFAAWKTKSEDPEGVGAGYRVMTEAEHHRIRDIDNAELGPMNDPPMTNEAANMPDAYGYNLNLAYGSESSVKAMPPNNLGFHDSFGNVWQWMEDHMSALPGFKVDALYDDFTIPCFDGEHNLILGGLFISTGDEASHFARFHFRPHFHQHAGFRLVEPNSDDSSLLTSCMDNQGPYVGMNPFRTTVDTAKQYRQADVLGQWTYAHFNDSDDTHIPSEAREFQVRLANMLMEEQQRLGAKAGRVLDVGCSVGRCSFELSKVYNEVIGLDVSAGSIRIANEILSEGQHEYSVFDEGAIKQSCFARRPDGTNAEAITFKQADAMCLAPDLGAFDAVVVSNVLDRLAAPQTLLSRLGGPRGIVRSGGLLVVASPFSWTQQYTPKDIWLGGFEEDGQAVRSSETVAATLRPNFELISKSNYPLALREHSRKCEYISSEVSLWRHR